MTIYAPLGTDAQLEHLTRLLVMETMNIKIKWVRELAFQHAQLDTGAQIMPNTSASLRRVSDHSIVTA